VGRVPSGAIVERASPSVPLGKQVRLQLRQADYTTASRLADAVNKKFGAGGKILARAENSALVNVDLPDPYLERPTAFIGELENITIDTDRMARVVVNERTGTIAMGKEVRISPVAVMHGNLTVEIQTSYAVSQPSPLSSGSTEVVPQVGVGIKEEKTRNLVLKEGATVEELVKALSSIGATPRDVIAILQALHGAGALEAELEVI
jgi:flagellar P-ring protein precursor FlgI